MPSLSTRPTYTRKLPGVVDNHVRDLLEALNQLFDLICDENLALSKMDFETAKGFLEDKVARTREYQRQMLAVHRNPALLLTLTDEQREIMKGAGEALNAVATENGRHLQAAMDAIDILVQSFFDAVRENAAVHTANYEEDGTVQPNMSIAENRSVALNKTL